MFMTILGVVLSRRRLARQRVKNGGDNERKANATRLPPEPGSRETDERRESGTRLSTPLLAYCASPYYLTLFGRAAGQSRQQQGRGSRRELPGLFSKKRFAGSSGRRVVRRTRALIRAHPSLARRDAHWLVWRLAAALALDKLWRAMAPAKSECGVLS